jgi:hypothetical protein
MMVLELLILFGILWALDRICDQGNSDHRDRDTWRNE